MRHRNVLNLKRSLPCMSWHPKNLYNLWKQTIGPGSEQLTFKQAGESTLFQQRWKSKAAVRAYHGGEFIPEKVFKRWYLPDTLPDVRPKREVREARESAGVDDKLSLDEFAGRAERAKEARRRQKEKEKEEEKEEIEQKGLAPVGSLMFSEVERRLDVFVFRACFAHSVFEARRLIIHGYVTLNGKKHNKPNTRLAPGDMVHVNPDAMRFFKKPHGEYDNVLVSVGLRPAEAKPEVEAEVEAEPKTETRTQSVTKRVVSEFNRMVEAEVKALGLDVEEDDVQKPDQHRANHANPNPTGKYTPFHLPPYASPFLFIPAYMEVSFLTCTAIYVRHPTARPGYSEIPTPYEADGALVRYAWEWYVHRRGRVSSKSQIGRGPEDRVVTLSKEAKEGKRDTRLLDWGKREEAPHLRSSSDARASRYRTGSASTTSRVAA